MTYIVLAHGGTGSDKDTEMDGVILASQRGLQALKTGGSPLDAVVEACVILEDDERYNAGTGSNLMFDGAAIEMDAACMASDGRFGAVSAIRDVKNPIRVARDVLETPHNVLVGEGAVKFARVKKHPHHNPWTERAQKKYVKIMESIRAAKYSRSDCEWDLEFLQDAWNYELPMDATIGIATARAEGRRIGAGDTVGAVATDGETYAAAASTGGTITTLLGRVGDTSTLGAGVFAGEAGAVACTGNGDHIMRKVLAYRIHTWLESGVSPNECTKRVKKLFPEWVDCFVVVVAGEKYAAGGNRDVAWSVARDD